MARVHTGLERLLERPEPIRGLRTGLVVNPSSVTSDLEHASVALKSRRGEVKVKAKVTQEVPPGMVWMAFHFREACANWLTNPVFDPVSQTAEYKACAVRIEKI